MDAILTCVKLGADKAEADKLIAKAKNLGWTVEYTLKGTE